MADIKIVNDQGEEVVDEVKEPVTPPVVTGGEPDEFLEPIVHRIMGLENDSEKIEYRDKVKILIDYAKQQTDDHSPENIGWILRDFDMRVGSGPFAEKRINYLANYAALKMDRREIDKKIKEIEHKSV